MSIKSIHTHIYIYMYTYYILLFYIFSHHFYIRCLLPRSKAHCVVVVAEGCGDTLLESSGEVDGGLADFELANTEDFHGKLYGKSMENGWFKGNFTGLSPMIFMGKSMVSRRFSLKPIR